MIDNEQNRDNREEFIEYLQQNSENRIQELRQQHQEQIEKQEKLYQTIIDEKTHRIIDLQQQIDDLIQQRNKQENKPNQTFNFQGANFGGGFAGRDYQGNIINDLPNISIDNILPIIHQWIKQLSQNLSLNNISQQMQIATYIISMIENNPSLKEKAILANQQHQLETLTSHPIGRFIVNGIRQLQ